jgi:hypothetical protein
LYGLLSRLRDAGLGLTAAERMRAPGESMNVAARTTERSKEHSNATD